MNWPILTLVCVFGTALIAATMALVRRFAQRAAEQKVAKEISSIWKDVEKKRAEVIDPEAKLTPEEVKNELTALRDRGRTPE